MWLGAAVVAGEAAAEDLWTIYQRARQADAQYKAAEYEYRRAQLSTPLAKSARRPQVTIRGDVGRRRTATEAGEVDTIRDNQININAQMPIYDRALNRAVKQAELRVSAAAVDLEQAHAELIVRVAEGYFAVLAARDEYEVARKQQIAIARQLNFTKQWLAAGIGTQADVFDAQARYAQAEAEVIAAENRIANARQTLKQIIGGPPPRLIELDKTVPLQFPVPDEITVWIDKSLRHNFQLRRARLGVQIAAEDIKRQRAARLPVIGLTATAQRRDVGETGGGFANNKKVSSAHATVTWPVLRGGGMYYATKQAGFAYNAAAQARIAAERQAETDATAAYLAVGGSMNQARAFGDAVRAGEASLAAKQEGFRAGLSTNLEVLDAQRDLSRSQSDYLAARYAFIIATLRLEQTVGRLDADDVRRVNAWLGGD